MRVAEIRGLLGSQFGLKALVGVRVTACSRESGAVVVEAALVMVLLVSAISGIVEVGSLSRARIVVERLAWSAARVTAMDTASGSSDFDVLKAVGESLEATPGAVLRRVVVFRSDTTSGTPPEACRGLLPMGAAARGVQGLCNVYGPDHVEAVVSSASMPTGCSPPSWEAAWCPESRVRDRRASAHAGVLIELEQHPVVVGLFTFGARTLSATAVVKLEVEVR